MNVLIGTPSYDGKLEARYVDSLIRTKIAGLQNNLTIDHIFITNDALVQRARNDIFKLAYDFDVDYLFFIDSDIDWEPEQFFRVLTSGKDFIGGIYRLKNDELTYVFKPLPEQEHLEKNRDKEIIEVMGIGTGFLCLSKKVIQTLYESAETYENFARMVFEVKVENGSLIAEDIMLCKKWRELGEQVFCLTSVKVAHNGTKRYI